MLCIDSLLAVRTIVTHEGCADGIASAIILRDALPNARVESVQYNTPAHRDLRATPGMLFCDMTPLPARVQEFVDAGAIVLDHHKGAREIVDAFGERGVFADEAAEPGVSGATLAFREVWLPLMRHASTDTAQRMHDFASLAGIRDTWQTGSPRWREARAQEAALRFWPPEMLIGVPLDALSARLEIADTLLVLDEQRDNQSLAEAHRFQVGGVRVLAFDGTHVNDIAERVRGDVDLVLGWRYLVEEGRQRIKVSVRTSGDVSALAFAKANGGGGHEHSGGFKIDAPADASPYTLLYDLVCRHAGAIMLAA